MCMTALAQGHTPLVLLLLLPSLVLLLVLVVVAATAAATNASFHNLWLIHDSPHQRYLSWFQVTSTGDVLCA
jgi:hypothetical protein